MSALGSQRVSRLQFSMGLTGTWRAEVWPDEGTAPSGAVDLVVGGVTFKGTVARGGTDAPDKPHIVHVGAPGWDRPADAPLSWQNDAGVRLSTVLKDLARLAGETVEQPGDVVLGKSWGVTATRPGAVLRYSDALAALTRGRYLAPWRVDPDGVTRFGARVLAAVDVTKANVLRRNEAAGTATLGGDDFSALLPGASFEGAIITRLDISERPSNLQATVWTRSPAAIESILRAVGRRFPQLVYGHPRTYTVAATYSDGRLDLDPPADAAHLERLPKVEQWGLGGARVTPLIGSEVVVLFRDANPSRPVAVAFSPLATSTPTKVEIDADAVKLGAGAATVVRVGDKIAVDATPGPTLGTVSFIGTSVAAHSKVDA